jgi:hypothetical protein
MAHEMEKCKFGKLRKNVTFGIAEGYGLNIFLEKKWR